MHTSYKTYVLIVCSSLILFTTYLSFAQNKKASIKDRTTSDSMYKRTRIRNYSVPAFLSLTSTSVRDSYFCFEYYSKNKKQINVRYINAVDSIVYLRYFYDSTHMVKDSIEGLIPKVFIRNICSYKKLGTSQWVKSFSGIALKDTITEDIKEIIKRDTIKVYQSRDGKHVYYEEWRIKYYEAK